MYLSILTFIGRIPDVMIIDCVCLMRHNGQNGIPFMIIYISEDPFYKIVCIPYCLDSSNQY